MASINIGTRGPVLLPTLALSGTGAGNVNNGTHWYGVTFVTAYGETTATATPPNIAVANNAVNGKVQVTNIPIGPPGVTQRKLYRLGPTTGGVYKLVTTLADNTTTSYLDNAADASLGANYTGVNTTLFSPEILKDGAQEDEPILIGANVRTFNKTLRAMGRGEKRRWSIQFILPTQADYTRVRSIIQAGQVIVFSGDLWGEVVFASARLTAGPWVKHGTSFMRLAHLALEEA
jgi:hypothetical protein